VPPKGVLELSIGYEGTIRSDATRLTRIGVPENVAIDTDWDKISNEFTAVRGIGYVTWYPIATAAANLSEGNSVFAAIERWKTRHADSSMSVLFQSTSESPIFFSGNKSVVEVGTESGIAKIAAYDIPRFGMDVPVFAAANYKTIQTRNISSVNYLPGSDDAAKTYADLVANLDPPLFARREGSLQIIQLANSGAAPFVSDSVLLTPLNSPISTDTELDVIYALAHQSPNSQRAWIHDGLAHYAQLHHIEQAGGRQAVLAYLGTRRPLLAEAQKTTETKNSQALEASASLINSGDDAKSQIKAMWVWWMLRDMCGESTTTTPMLSYQSTTDKEPAYMQHLIEATCKKDLEWFFDDWVYRDKGLPDFRITSVYPRKNLKEGYLVTVTVENLGIAGAEVPVVVHAASGDITERLIVRGKSQASVRLSTQTLPDQVTVNDGSVPESDVSNNTFKVEPTAVDNH